MDIPQDFLSKDFLSQFKSEEDVSNFLTDCMPAYWNKC